MQSLDVISINLWQILISLCNLLILFFILKKFLYAPIRKAVRERESALRSMYQRAEEAQEAADANRLSWENEIKNAEDKTNEILTNASERANRIGEQIISQAKENAEIIMRDAKKEADAEYEKAQAKIKKEIVDISALLTEKILDREIRFEDHRAIIEEVVSEIGDTND